MLAANIVVLNVIKHFYLVVWRSVNFVKAVILIVGSLQFIQHKLSSSKC